VMFYFQDTWRATRKLNLTIGVRYELEGRSRSGSTRSVRGFDPAVAQPNEAAAKAAYARSPSRRYRPRIRHARRVCVRGRERPAQNAVGAVFTEIMPRFRLRLLDERQDRDPRRVRHFLQPARGAPGRRNAGRLYAADAALVRTTT